MAFVVAVERSEDGWDLLLDLLLHNNWIEASHAEIVYMVGREV